MSDCGRRWTGQGTGNMIIQPQFNGADPCLASLIECKPVRVEAADGEGKLSKSGTFTFRALGCAALLAGCPAYAQALGCIAHHAIYLPGQIETSYEPGCTGHDEPELMPVSNAPGSARDLMWTVVLPAAGTGPVSAVGPAFWFGGVVTDPKSLFGQSFVELQFYPDSIVNKCLPTGAFSVTFAPDIYTACSPVFRLTTTGAAGKFRETAAFNAMLTEGTGRSPLIMHAGDTITIHWFTTAAQDGFHVTVTDLTTQASGTIVLNSNAGPLMPAFDTQSIGNSLAWGLVDDAPNSFVWEIGHMSIYSSSPDAFCVPGQTGCDSYNAPSWAAMVPIRILSVTFGDGSQPDKWAVVSDTGGKAEVNASCSTYGGPFCIYPWYTLTSNGFHYGVDYPDTRKDFRQASQFAQTMQCGGPFGANTTFCSTILK